MAQELNIGRLVRVSYTISPLAAARRGFGTLLILGDSTVISVTERIRFYTTLDAVALDFGLLAPEYLAAALYYAQSPRPLDLAIGRWNNPGETAAAAVIALADISSRWYGLMFSAAVELPDADVLAVALLVEGLTPSRIFGHTETLATIKDPLVTTDIGTQLKDLLYRRSLVQFSPNVRAVASLFGRAFSVNFNANRSTITLMYKQEPGVAAESLSESQAQALKFKRVNVFVKYNNDTAIIQYGVMSGLAFIDEIHGLDWFTDAVQNRLWNRLFQSQTKIPQTDAGQNVLVAECAAACDEAVNNGLVAPGQWNGDAFGQLETGQFLKTGYYIWTSPMALQAQAIREQRIAPPIQIALKLAGAIHEVDVLISVNR
ncbi:MAG: DUF3383 family protein [Burkholderiales bacterium]